ncbi:MAG: ParB/RepB/Spo0J family partition protein, partial [Clostridia bacterium]|nr:ParB/RepB/Spo0J family partition protein [Clostridia bacterium]
EKAGEKVGRSRPYITNALRLLSLPQLICDMIASGALSAGHGRALVENLQRQDLNPIEEALGYRRLMDDYGYSQEKAGEKVGRSRPYITNALRLLSLPQLICDMIASGALSAGHGRALVVLDEQKAMEAAKSILEKDLSVRETEALVKRMLEDSPDAEEEKKEDAVAMYVRELERSLASSTGHKISIKHGRKKGKLTIEYYGNDDLDKICAALNKIEKE